MKVAIMQPYFFPYIGYWQLINAVDVFVIFDDVSFRKRSFINRNYILLNEKKHLVTLEVKGGSQNRKINEIEVGDNKRKILETIRHAYSNAQFFNIIFDFFKKIIIYNEKNLARYLGFLIKKMAEYLNINTKILYSSGIEKDNNLRGEKKIIYILKELGSSTYINPIGGMGLYKKENFKKQGINLFFLKSESIEYQQFNNNFIDNLSIIDIMMFVKKNKILKFLNQFSLL